MCSCWLDVIRVNGGLTGNLIGSDEYFCCDSLVSTKNKLHKGNDRSPESQQVQSLDKVNGFLPYTVMVATLVM